MSDIDNLVSLKQYFEGLREADQRALAAALAAAEKGVSAALAASEKAITKAENAAEKRFELLNELRAGVATTEQLEALDKVVQSIDKRLTSGKGRSGGINDGWKILLGALGAATAVASLMRFFG